jgi:hypothetical protein
VNRCDGICSDRAELSRNRNHRRVSSPHGLARDAMRPLDRRLRTTRSTSSSACTSIVQCIHSTAVRMHTVTVRCRPAVAAPLCAVRRRVPPRGVGSHRSDTGPTHTHTDARSRYTLCTPRVVASPSHTDARPNERTDRRSLKNPSPRRRINHRVRRRIGIHLAGPVWSSFVLMVIGRCARQVESELPALVLSLQVFFVNDCRARSISMFDRVRLACSC